MCHRAIAVVLASLLVSAVSASAQTASLKSPSAGLVAAVTSMPATPQCAPVPPPMRNVIGVSYYTDSAHHSVVDPQKLAQNEANLNPIRNFLQSVTDASDAAARGDGNAAACGLRLLFAWAQGDAMNGAVNHQGEYEREWTLGGLALAYLKIRDTGAADPNSAMTTAWFGRLARNVEPYYPPTGELNNHDYWAGVAVAAAGIAANDRAARAAMRFRHHRPVVFCAAKRGGSRYQGRRKIAHR